MKTTTYNKLIRDNIPEIITESGKTAVTEVLSDGEFIKMLDKKLTEELAEYQESKDIEELADILEVIYAIAQTRVVSIVELEKLRLDKADKRGAFSKKILLKEVAVYDIKSGKTPL